LDLEKQTDSQVSAHKPMSPNVIQGPLYTETRSRKIFWPIACFALLCSNCKIAFRSFKPPSRPHAAAADKPPPHARRRRRAHGGPARGIPELTSTLLNHRPPLPGSPAMSPCPRFGCPFHHASPLAGSCPSSSAALPAHLRLSVDRSPTRPARRRCRWPRRSPRRRWL